MIFFLDKTAYEYYHSNIRNTGELMGKLVRFGVSLDQDLLEKFDRLMKDKDYTSRSEAFRDLIRQELVQKQWQSGQDVGNHQNGTKSNRGGSFGGRRWRLGSQIRDKGSPWQLILRIEDTQLFLTSIRPPFACNKTSV